MATFSFAELVLNDHLTNSSNYNPTTMTNSPLTSLSTVKAAGHKRKRSSIPDILSTTAGRAKKFLKKIGNSFVTSSDDSFSPNKIVPNNGVSPLGEHGKNKVQLSQSSEKISIKEKNECEKIDTCDALGSGAFVASRSPKAICFDSVSSTKWSRLEISMSPKKCEQTSSEGLLPPQCGNIFECSSHRDVVSSSHIHTSRILHWDQVSTDDAIKRVLPRWSDFVGGDQIVGERQMPYLNGTRWVTASEHDLCMSLNTVVANNQPSKLGPKAKNVDNKHVLRHHLQSGSCLAIKNYEPSSVKYKNLFTHATNPLIKDDYTESMVLKSLLDDGGFFSENVDAISETVSYPTGRATKIAQEKDKKEVEAEIGVKVTDISLLNDGPNSIRIKSIKSLLFLPFPNVPFKIKAIQPTHVCFEVSYTESNMIPTVKTAGDVFEAKLQEVTIDSAGQEGFRNSLSEFCCTITVETSDPVSKFEEIKHALRVVCDAYNIGMEGSAPDNSIKRIRAGRIEEAIMIKKTSYNTVVSGSTCKCNINEALTEQYNLQASSVDCDSTADMSSDNQVSFSEETMSNNKKGRTTAAESSNSQEAFRPVRRSHRKVKMAGLWKERNAYATKVTRPTSPLPMQDKNNSINCPFNFVNDQKYLDRRMIVNQFVQDITGVPVVVLERLKSQELQDKLNTSSITGT